MIAVPGDFAAAIVRRAGEPGRAWVAGLPSLVEALCRRWGLVVDGAPLHGWLGLVVPVRRGAEPAALKVSWRDPSAAHEILALRAWDGQGTVRLLEAEPAVPALLLERLDSRRTLRDLSIGEAVAVAGQLLRRLSVPAPAGLPRLSDAAAGLSRSIPERWEALGRPLPRRLVEAASDLAAQLGPAAGSALVNWDLHYGNVLAGQREPWLAIDPKALAGDPEYGVAPLLWTRLEDMERAGGPGRHFAALVERAGLDRQRARAWTLVRLADYWLWALGAGLTEDPASCERLAGWLDSRGLR